MRGRPLPAHSTLCLPIHEDEPVFCFEGSSIELIGVLTQSQAGGDPNETTPVTAYTPLRSFYPVWEEFQTTCISWGAGENYLLSYESPRGRPAGGKQILLVHVGSTTTSLTLPPRTEKKNWSWWPFDPKNFPAKLARSHRDLLRTQPHTLPHISVRCLARLGSKSGRDGWHPVEEARAVHRPMWYCNVCLMVV